jgi:hypothetical protein
MTMIQCTVDGTPHAATYKGDMMGAELWQLEAPGQPSHGTSLLFLSSQTIEQRRELVAERARLAAIPARERMDLAARFAEVERLED